MESRERRNHLTDFCNKYIEYFEHEYGRSPQSFYDFFDTFVFPKECDRLGFRMDSGESFIEKYGTHMLNEVCPSSDINDVTDIQLIGNALYSKWRYYNHWASSHPGEDEIKWFIVMLRQMKKLISIQDNDASDLSKSKR